MFDMREKLKSLMTPDGLKYFAKKVISTQYLYKGVRPDSDFGGFQYSFQVKTFRYEGDFTSDGDTGIVFYIGFYTKGVGHGIKKRTGQVTAPLLKPEEVLLSLLSDAECAQGTFADFCADSGYDEDSRKALKMYEDCQKTGEVLRKIGFRDFSAAREILDV